MKPCIVNDNAQSDESPKQDIYARITAKIVAALEDGVRPWGRPWDAGHAAGAFRDRCVTTASPTPASDLSHLGIPQPITATRRGRRGRHLHGRNSRWPWRRVSNRINASGQERVEPFWKLEAASRVLKK